MSQKRITELTSEYVVSNLKTCSNQRSKEIFILNNDFFEDSNYLDINFIERLECLCVDLKRNLDETREWLHLSRTLNGNVFRGNIPHMDEFFVVKVATLQEIFIGLYGVNQLRKQVPNFVYTFGYFTCSAPFGSKNHVAYCVPTRDDSQSHYAIMENVVGKTVYETLVYTSYESSQYLRDLLQIGFALKALYETIGGTHYDLHLGNVIRRELPVNNTSRMMSYIHKGESCIFPLTRLQPLLTLVFFG